MRNREDKSRLPRREDWELEVGNAAVVTEVVHYRGTRRGAVRAASRRWRERAENETVLILRRPGCQPVRVWRREEER